MFDQLRAIQQKFGYLPADQLHQLAARINVPVSQIHTVASFYPHFHLTPPPRAEVKVCADMTCHLRGGPELKAELEQTFRGSSPDDVSIRDVSCLGRCDKAAALAINDRIYCGLDAREAVAIARDAAAGRPLPPEPRDRPQVSVISDPYSGAPSYSLVRRFVETRDWSSTIATLKASGLRGMGGAGFPTGNKWEIVRNAPGKAKYIVCNADESEPGTIKDRFIMEAVPHLVIEGMIIAGLVTGAQQGILYIRHEYEEPREVLQQEIDRCYHAGLLGKKILGSELTFELEIFISPGGYICGEESALLEAIEGKRSEPRNKPPFPGTNGLWNQPTVINNVETFTFATAILARGADWFKAQGKNGSAGMKFVGISGDVNSPGVFEVPMGTTYSELISRESWRHRGTTEVAGLRSFGPVVRLSARIDGRPATRLERRGGCRIHGGLGRHRCLRRRPLHARHGSQRRAFLSKRILRQVRSLPIGIAEDGRNANWMDRRPISKHRSPGSRRTLQRDEADLHLRPGSGRSRSHCIRP